MSSGSSSSSLIPLLFPIKQFLFPLFAQFDDLFEQGIEFELLLDLLHQIHGGHLQQPQRLDELGCHLLLEA